MKAMLIISSMKPLDRKRPRIREGGNQSYIQMKGRKKNVSNEKYKRTKKRDDH